MKWTKEFDAILNELIEQNERGTIEGVHPDIPIEIYHHPLCPGLSNSDLKYAAQSFDHLTAYKARRLQEMKDPNNEQPRPLVIGSAFHDSLFTPDRFKSLYKEEPVQPEYINRRTNAGKIEYADWIENVLKPFQLNNVGLSKEEISMLLSMKEKADRHESFQSVVRGSEKEATLFFRDAQTGILLKVRPDVMNHDLAICLDAKTTSDARPTAFRKTIASYCYDKQAAMQVDGIKAIFKKSYDFIFSAHEKEDPFGLAMYRLDDACLEVGRTLYRRDLDYISMAMKNEAPRGYPTEIVSIGLPAWAFDITSR